jgi:hypothetical protein
MKISNVVKEGFESLLSIKEEELNELNKRLESVNTILKGFGNLLSIKGEEPDELNKLLKDVGIIILGLKFVIHVTLSFVFFRL